MNIAMSTILSFTPTTRNMETNMKQEDKELLTKDLCARLPYGVKVNFSSTECILSNIGNDGFISLLKSDKKAIYATDIQYIKPYLRPMSDMTEKEKDEYNRFIFDYEYDDYWNPGKYRDTVEV